MDGNSIRVLLVDDNVDDRNLIRTHLEGRSGPIFAVSVACTAKEGLARARDDRPDVVLLDYWLPDVDGISTLTGLVETMGGGVPVIILTGRGNETVAAGAIKQGASDYVTKDVAGEYLRRLVDVIERNLSEHALKRDIETLKRRQHVILNAAGEGILGLSADGLITFANPKAITMLAAAETGDRRVIGKPLTAFFEPNDEVAGYEPESLPRLSGSCSSRSSGFTTDGYRVRTLRGNVFPAELTCTPIRDERGTFEGAVVVFRDITDRKLVEQQLEHMAKHDALTGLANRAMLRQLMPQSLARADRSGLVTALLFIDLDDFKEINDEHGHDVGDVLLRGAAERLRRSLRDSDVVCRLGGDEFLVLAEGLERLEDASLIADKVLEVLEPGFSIRDKLLRISTSIGIATFPACASTADELLRNADLAMYAAKRAGGNTYRYFSMALNDRIAEQRRIAEQVGGAVDRSEFRVHFQPRVTLQSGRISGAEAFLRWREPNRGLLRASEFLDAAERSNDAQRLDHWIIDQACRYLQAWTQAGLFAPPDKLAVNVSSRQLARVGFIGMVRDAIALYDIDPSQLQFEITERSLGVRRAGLRSALKELAALGTSLAVDDFGTGSSTLAYLHKLPIDAIKIDESFIHTMTHNARDAAFVRSVIALGASLGLTVIAEGVETADQMAHLTEQGCDQIQGYYCSPPLPADGFYRLLAQTRGVAVGESEPTI